MDHYRFLIYCSVFIYLYIVIVNNYRTLIFLFTYNNYLLYYLFEISSDNRQLIHMKKKNHDDDENDVVRFLC